MEKRPFDIEAAIRDLKAICERHDERLDKSDSRFDRIEARLERHDDLLTTMVKMMTQFERTQSEHSRRFEQLDAKIDLRFEQMQSDFRAFKEVLLDHGQRINALEERVFHKR